MEAFPSHIGNNGIPYGFFDHLYVELTDRCNLHCKHCYLAAGPKQAHTLPPELVSGAIADFSAMGGHTVAFSGGEPLLYDGLDSLAQNVKNQNLFCTIVTNCTLLDNARIKGFIEQGTLLAVSLEGACASTHDAVRGKGNYAKVQKALDTLAHIHAQERVIICFTPMKPNLKELPQLFNNLMRKGFMRFYVSLLEERGRQKRNAEELALSTRAKVRLLSELILLLSDVRFPCRIDTGHLAPFFNRLIGQAPWDGKEDPVEGTLRIDATGDVYLSAYAEGKRFCLGNIYKDGLNRVVRSTTLNNLLSELSHRFDNTNSCKQCPFMIVCCGGSPARAYTRYQDFRHPDDFCKARQLFLDQWFHV